MLSKNHSILNSKFGNNAHSIFKTVPKSFCGPKVEKCASVTPQCFKCYKCTTSFPSYSEMVLHLKLIHNACASRDCSKISDFKMHSSVCINRGFGCTICNRNFSEKYLFFAHFYEHIDAAVYACEICREGFQQRKDLQRHLLHVHDKIVSLPVIPSHSKTVYQKCGHCSKYFRLFAEFEEHVSSCNASTYACCVCQVIFSTLSALDEHRLFEHKLEHAIKGHAALKQGKKYFCGICYLGFFKGNILKKHLITHKIDSTYICDVCHVNFTCDNDLQSHYLQHIEEHYVLHDLISQHSCNSCMKTFKTQKELKYHLAVKNCKSNDEQHNFRAALSNEVQANKFNRTCDDLAMSANTISAKLTTINDSNGSHDCAESPANTPFDTSEVPVYALKSGEELLNCDDSKCVMVMDLLSLFVLQRGICSSENRIPDFTNSEAYNENDVIDASLLQKHMLQILSANNENSLSNSEESSCVLNNIEASCFEQDLNTDSETVTLSIMSNDDSTKFSVLENNESLPVIESVSSVNPDNTNEAYEFLDFSTNSESFIDHSEELSGDIITQAKVSCFSEHANSGNVNEELLMECNDELSVSDLYICNICKQVFSSKISLCLHIKGSHSGFNCSQCGDSFNSEDELKVHEKILHISLFQCDLCDVSYSEKNLLEKHKHSVHESKKFFCSVCNKSYASKDEFGAHVLVHNGETPTKCEICGKIYASVSNYIRHKALHEGKSPAKKMKVHESPTTCECPKCNMYFPINVLAEHIASHDIAL